MPGKMVAGKMAGEMATTGQAAPTTPRAGSRVAARPPPLLAVAGFLVIVLGYTAFLALEFLLLRVINRSDPAPQPTWADLASAWLGETLTAPRVFCWRQPFRPFAVPDNLVASGAMRGQPGVVFIHGFFCNRAFWNPWLQRLQAGKDPSDATLEVLALQQQVQEPLTPDEQGHAVEVANDGPLEALADPVQRLVAAWSLQESSPA